MWGFERRWFRLIAESVFPGNADARLTMGAGDLPLERFLIGIWRRAPLQMRLALRAALWIVTLSPLLVIGCWRCFPSLTPAERLTHLRKLAQSRTYLLRELPLLLKTVICMAVCGHPRLQRQAGITGYVGSTPDWIDGTEP